LSAWFENFRSYLWAASGVDKEEVKEIVAQYHLQPLWDLVRDLYLEPGFILFAMPLFLLLATKWPADKKQKLLSANSALDYLYPIFKLPLQVTVVVYLVTTIEASLATQVPAWMTGLVDNQPVPVQAICAFLVIDFTLWAQHWVKHKVPWFWQFHVIHHSQRQVNMFTTLRVHPMEDVISAVVVTIPIVIVGGSPPAYFLLVLYQAVHGYLVHANVKTNLGWLKYVLVTPQSHRVHHSIEGSNQMNKNFGEVLTIWDWIFQTQYKDFDCYPESGLAGVEALEERKFSIASIVKLFVAQTVYPFLAIAESVMEYGRRKKSLST
jgi:sterol desaturase/sphingolipid hydroxylase (fatty acid hydroxylase superfamily)